MRRLVAGLVAAAAIVACFPQGQCEGSFVEYCAPGDTTCQGTLLDANHWVSGPLTGDWLDFGHERTWLMHFRDGKTGADLQGTVFDVTCDVSPVKRPNDPGNQFAPGAGNLCEITMTGDGAYVRNDTCADYFVYVTATAVASAPADAGTE